MSTRCNIIVKDDKGNRIYLYHHHDGYPEGVGTDLKFWAKSAKWGVYRHYAHSVANSLLKGLHSPFYGYEDKDYELTSGLHGDIDYFYIVKLYSNADPDKCGCAIEAYKALWPSEYAEYADTMLAIDGQICAAVEIPETEDEEEAK